MARDLTNALLASPNQASTVFGVGGAHPIRQKSLFVMRFLRRVGDGSSDWSNGLSFLVKSVDRPTIQPVVEELNQYNKKRVIHTGVKYSPINCILYDTADGAVMSMLDEYSRFYFGDFRQDASSYADDIVSAKMLGTNGATDLSLDGFGFRINKTTSASVDGANTQFFFDRIEVYQVWGGEFTGFQLLNPRIANYDPDDLDYENQNANTVTMSLNYEAFINFNGGKPQKISSNAALTEIFGGTFSGETFDPEPSSTRTTSFVSTTATPSISLSATDIQSLLNNDTSVTDFSESDRSDTTTSTGGALSQYGNFDFGDFTSLGSSLPSELSTLATDNPGGLTDPFPSSITTTKQANELELARILASQKKANTDAMSAALGGNISSLGNIASGVGTASLLQGNTPSDQVSYGDDEFMAGLQDSPETSDDSSFGDFGFAFPAMTLDAVDDEDVIPAPAPNDAKISSTKYMGKQGLSLSPLAIATVNTTSNGRSQIGQRKNTSENPLLAFIIEPLPSQALSPDLLYGRIRLASIVVVAHGSVNHQPRPVAGPIAKAVPITVKSFGFVTVAGSINDQIVIQPIARVLNTISGSVINATWTFRQNNIPTMVGIAPILGLTNPTTDSTGKYVSNPVPIQITSNIRMQTTVAGSIDRKRVQIFGDAVGVVKNRAATLNKPVPIKMASTGIVIVSGGINLPIKIKMDSIIIQLVHGDLPLTVPISMQARGIHIQLRRGIINNQVNIFMQTTGTVKAPVIGTINKPITPAFIALGLHKQPNKGTIAKPVIISSVSYARVPFFGKVVNVPIKINAALLGNVQPFGTINKQIKINATLTGSSLVFGTINNTFRISGAAVGHSTTNVSPAHRYWRMQVISTNQSIVGPNEVQFRDTNGNALAGTVTASSSYNATYAPGKAFDRDGSTWWSTAMGQATGAWLELDLGQGGDKEVKDLLIATDDSARVPTAYRLQYSDDNTYWDTKYTASITTPDNNSIYLLRGDTSTPPVSQTVEYRGLYRFRTITNSTGDSVRIANLVLYNQNSQPIPSMSPFASSTAVGVPGNAFDSDINSVWVSSMAEAQTATVGFYAATLDTQIGSISLRADPSTGGGACMPTGFVIEYSNDDGATWTIVLDESGGVPAFTDGEIRNITLGINGSVDVGDGSALQVNDNQDVLGY